MIFINCSFISIFESVTTNFHRNIEIRFCGKIRGCFWNLQMIYMEIEELRNFLFERSDCEKSRFRGFNFLYSPTSFNNEYNQESFSDQVKFWVAQTNQELNDKFNQTNDIIERITIKSELNVLEIIENKSFLIEWLNCVERINQVKKRYVQELIKIKKPIKYLIISEAPPLSFIDNKLSSNYVFFNIDNNTDKYRSVPFEVIKSLEKDTKSSLSEKSKGDDLLEFYANHRVAFIDIIPIPLPTIASNLRKHWCTDIFYSIDCKTPRIIQLLNLSITEFKKELVDIGFDEDLKIAFMAPTIISDNIVKWLAVEKFEKTQAKEFLSIFPKRLRHLDYSNLSELIAVDGSHNPNKNKLISAFRL